jgi:haloalkane dehalogenase
MPTQEDENAMTDISPIDPYSRRRVAILDSEMAFVDTGSGAPVVFLHGNPTSSYLWRNVIPHVEPLARCLAPDLIGMGESARAPAGSYRFVDHARYLDAWFDALELTDVVLVVHDWGSGLGFDWARRHPGRVRGIVHMEAIVQPMRFADFPAEARAAFEAMRSEAGEELVLQQNMFVEKVMPAGIMRQLTDEEFDVYRRPYLEAGESRRPTLTWPREIPIDGSPADTHDIVAAYSAWLAESELPKLFINTEPGRIMGRGDNRAFCRTWPNQTEVTVAGMHYAQEDSPHEIGRAVADFVAGL